MSEFLDSLITLIPPRSQALEGSWDTPDVMAAYGALMCRPGGIEVTNCILDLVKRWRDGLNQEAVSGNCPPDMQLAVLVGVNKCVARLDEMVRMAINEYDRKMQGLAPIVCEDSNIPREAYARHTDLFGTERTDDHE